MPVYSLSHYDKNCQQVTIFDLAAALADEVRADKARRLHPAHQPSVGPSAVAADVVRRSGWPSVRLPCRQGQGHLASML